ncbi:TPR end-of-group domain-containing protein [Porphyromonas cangingivalis]|uniref:TPR end-of-group domain-containing protein n=1 Tax=Porphyromonas cangingivalis TaxID=36874 RepID=UPI0012E05AAB|nr:hypothetical protein [Porphyromonas cangingivalis]
MATKYKPDDYESYNNWGSALCELAQRSSREKAEVVFREAIDKFHKAIEYGGRSYNLACLHAIRNEKGESLKYLDRSLSGREVTVEFVEQDKDWRGLS